MVPGWDLGCSGDPQTLRSALLLEGAGIAQGPPAEPDRVVEPVGKSNLQRGCLVEEYVRTRVRILTPCLVSEAPVGMLPSPDGGLGTGVGLSEWCSPCP